MSVSIIIPTAGVEIEKNLLPCVLSIQEHTDFNLIDVVVIVLNPFNFKNRYVIKQIVSSTIKSENLSKFHWIMFDEAIGYPKAINTGLHYVKEKSKSDFVVLLNDDAKFITISHPQKKNYWLDLLMEPFLKNQECGISGPILGFSEPAKHFFIVFFCAMVSQQVLDQVGCLNEIYSPGGGEDTDFCIRAERLGWKLCQVPYLQSAVEENDRVVGGFPIYHSGEQTVGILPDWQQIFERNSIMLKETYDQQSKLGNNNERAVIGANDIIPSREHARYQLAFDEIMKFQKEHPEIETIIVKDIGCSSGYGCRYIGNIPNVKYIGLDKDEEILKYAVEQFPKYSFFKVDLERPWDKVKKFLSCHVLIAFEVLEHLANGKEVSKNLQEEADVVLFTVPYDEEPGLWGPYHKLHHLTENDFDGYKFLFLTGAGQLLPGSNGDQAGLLIGKYEKSKSIIEVLDRHVLCCIPTKGRYDSTLPLTLMSVCQQERKPDHVFIYDDNEKPQDLRHHPILRPIVMILTELKIKWEVVFGIKKGQHFGHQLSQEKAKDLVWRIDDDEIANPNVLGVLLEHFKNNKVGAVGGLVITPPPYPYSKSIEKNGQIKYIDEISPQWCKLPGVLKVEHIYSTFLYKIGIAKYNLSLSTVAHREETMFVHDMFRRGYDLLVDPKAVTWHLRNEAGGIRSFTDKALWNHDEQIFRDYLQNWSVEKIKGRTIYLDVGLGDTIVFAKLIPELLAKYDHLTLAVAYPEVFRGMENITLISIQAAIDSGVDVRQDNVYAWMAQKQWKNDLLSAYRMMYLGKL